MKNDIFCGAYKFNGIEYLRLDELKRLMLDDNTRFIAVYDDYGEAKKFVLTNNFLICKDCKFRSKMQYRHLGELKYYCPKVEKYVYRDCYCYMGEKIDDN